MKKKTPTLNLHRETLRRLTGENLDLPQGGALRITVTGCTGTAGVTCLDC